MSLPLTRSLSDSLSLYMSFSLADKHCKEIRNTYITDSLRSALGNHLSLSLTRSLADSLSLSLCMSLALSLADEHFKEIRNAYKGHLAYKKQPFPLWPP